MRKDRLLAELFVLKLSVSGLVPQLFLQWGGERLSPNFPIIPFVRDLFCHTV